MNSTLAQRQRLLVRLREAPVSTLDARNELDILHPAARIQELRKAGNKIVIKRVERPTTAGKMHRVAEYVLSTGKRKK